MKISVIIPIYNGAKYLQQAVESVLNQPYKDLEVLCVDDGSTDNSAEIVKSLANKDSRVLYFYKKNGGGGSARNFGLDLAKGEYVQFLDQDDIWATNVLTNHLVAEILRNECDLVAFSYCNGNQNITRVSIIRRKNEILKGQSFEKFSMFHHSAYFYRRCFLKANGIYTDRYNGIDYNYRNEDVRFLIQVHTLAESIQCIDRVLFVYRNNESSVVHASIKGEKILCSSLSGYKKLAEETTNENIHRIACYYRTRYFLELLEYLSYRKDADRAGRDYYNGYRIEELIQEGYVSDYSRKQYELWDNNAGKFWAYKRKEMCKIIFKRTMAQNRLLRGLYHLKKYPIRSEMVKNGDDYD